MSRRLAPEIPADTEKTTKTPEKAEKPAGEKATRRSFGRGWLANSIEALCRKQADGKLKGYEGAPLTVSVLQSLTTNTDDEMPSTGAISAALIRWVEAGYIKKSGKPVAFVGFTAKYKDASLEKFLGDVKASKAKEKAAAKAAAGEPAAKPKATPKPKATKPAATAPEASPRW